MRTWTLETKLWNRKKVDVCMHAKKRSNLSRQTTRECWKIKNTHWKEETSGMHADGSHISTRDLVKRLGHNTKQNFSYSAKESESLLQKNMKKTCIRMCSCYYY